MDRSRRSSAHTDQGKSKDCRGLIFVQMETVKRSNVVVKSLMISDCSDETQYNKQVCKWAIKKTMVIYFATHCSPLSDR
ncbi:Hypothetical predicted protein [Xyrichtys novacula]|uniref:Uncharacterized protein n=1 Tax=Xyrichtys novacula TaxID=13765 RepID=A0AAV1GX22_XYRNO|nr:Hypothetical predicted protein [Xyrichtys novacula]